mgnify:CR=1 FL=1
MPALRDRRRPWRRPETHRHAGLEHFADDRVDGRHERAAGRDVGIGDSDATLLERVDLVRGEVTRICSGDMEHVGVIRGIASTGSRVAVITIAEGATVEEIADRILLAVEVP